MNTVDRRSLDEKDRTTAPLWCAVTPSLFTPAAASTVPLVRIPHRMRFYSYDVCGAWLGRQRGTQGLLSHHHQLITLLGIHAINTSLPHKHTRLPGGTCVCVRACVRVYMCVRAR
jgi:hypothetical protein